MHSFITSNHSLRASLRAFFCRATKYAFLLFLILFSYLFSYQDLLPSSSSLSSFFITFADACVATQWFDNGCNGCKPRYYCPDGVLIHACPVGTYQDAYDQAYCKACGAGQTSNYGETYCFDCPAGQYCTGCANPNDPGSCLVPGVPRRTCPKGAYCPTRSANPIHCGVGKYQNLDGASSSSQCISCPAGTLCPSSMNAGYTPCRAGYYCPNAQTETACPAGTYNPYQQQGSSAACRSSDRGHYSPSAARTSQIPCTAGMWQPNTRTAGCGACPAGYYCPSTGTFNPPSCAAGHYCPTQSTNQIPCPAGMWQPNTQRDSCDACPAGYYCPTAGTFDPSRCPPGHYCPAQSTSPTACSPGTWRQEDAATIVSDCVACAPGSASNISARTTSCDLCEIGDFQPNAGATSCIACPRKSRSPQRGATSIEDCVTLTATFTATLSNSSTTSLERTISDTVSDHSATPSSTIPETATSSKQPSASFSESQSIPHTETMSHEPTMSRTTREQTQSISSSGSVDPTPSSSISVSLSSSPTSSNSITPSSSPSASTSASNSISHSDSTSLEPTMSSSISTSLSPSPTTTDPITPSSSLSSSISESQSTSLTDTVFCMNLDERTCSTLPTQCKFCPVFDLCLQHTDTTGSDPCRCPTLPEEICTLPQVQTSCHFCSQHQVCVNSSTTSKSCDCFEMTEYACTTTNSTCKWCGNEKVCVPSPQECGCVKFSPELNVYNSFPDKRSGICRHSSSDVCTFCPQEDTCIESNGTCACHNLTRNACDASSLSPAFGSCRFCSEIDVCAPKTINCTCMALPQEEICSTAGECHWCPNYQTCAPTKDWKTCDCFELRNSNNCGNFTNDHCQWCPHEDTCADFSYNCTCELFNQSVCSTSRCNWCNDMQMCTVEENTECDCYYLREERFCSTTSNSKCSWCPSSQPFFSGDKSRVFQAISSFNYCIDRSKSDRCECSYLSPTFCNFSVSSPAMSSSTTPQFSSSCKYCPELDLCTSPQNSDCLCGSEFSTHGCGVASQCSWKAEVLTIEGAIPYCGITAAAGCDPVACEGIRTDSGSGVESCKASGCSYEEDVQTCASTMCFNFFVRGFHAQPFAFYFLGLFKDALVVLLVGAIGDFFSRPIMNFVLQIKASIKDWRHIQHRIWDKKSTLYMSDKFCRDGYPFSFSQYVEQVCEDSFEFLDDDGDLQIMCETLRLKLFDITAFCLFDNMLWIEPDLDIEPLLGRLEYNDPEDEEEKTRTKNTHATSHSNSDFSSKNDSSHSLHHHYQQEQEMTTLPNLALINDNDENSHPQAPLPADPSIFSFSPRNEDDDGRSNVHFTVNNHHHQHNNNNNNNNSGMQELDELEKYLIAGGEREKTDLDRLEESFAQYQDHHNQEDKCSDNNNNNNFDDCYMPPPAVRSFFRRNSHDQHSSTTPNLEDVVGTGDGNVTAPNDQSAVPTLDSVLLGEGETSNNQQQEDRKSEQQQEEEYTIPQKTVLKEKDFQSLVHLREIVEQSLIKRANKMVYYAQSRSMIVSASAAINSFPTAIQLFYYTITVAVLYVSAFSSVVSTDKIQRMVTGCDFEPAFGTNITNRTNTGILSSTDNNTTTGTHEDYFSSSFLLGAFLLLGFRLMNSSAQATSALILVKTARGLYQRYTGLYALTLQQRIPLMGLYADRAVQVALSIYALFILPFALAGPFYGGFAVNWRCWVPVAAGGAILFLNWGLLIFSRWLVRSRRLARDREKLQKIQEEKEAKQKLKEDQQQQKRKTKGENHPDGEHHDDSNKNLSDTMSPDPSVSVPNLNDADNADAAASFSPRHEESEENEVSQEEETGDDFVDAVPQVDDDEDDDDDDNDNETKKEDENEEEGFQDMMLNVINSAWRDGVISVKSLHDNLTKTFREENFKKFTSPLLRRRKREKRHDDDDEDEELSEYDKEMMKNHEELKILDPRVASHTSISSAAPVLLPKALLVFFLTEEIPILAVSLALQVSLNYLCLLKYNYAFGIRDDYDLVYAKDYEGRRIACVWESMVEDFSGLISGLASVVPFM